MKKHRKLTLKTLRREKSNRKINNQKNNPTE
jgi:uncharacterized protein YfeS